MIKTHLLSALRFMLRQKGFSVINIIGLTIGISCSLLIALYAYDELRYDSFHRDAEVIFRISTQSKFQDKESNTALSPALLAGEVLSLPEVEKSLRLVAWKTFPILYEDSSFTEDYLLLADSNFFHFFSFDLVIGNAGDVLRGERKIVLSESAAKRYFNYQGPQDQSPIGKTLMLAQGYAVQVTGIAKDAPSHSHIHFSHILSLDSWTELQQSSWLMPRVHTYIKVKPESKPDAIRNQLNQLLHNRVNQELTETRSITYSEFKTSGNSINVDLFPLTSIHLYSTLADEIEESGSIEYVYLFLTVSAFIALLACINFINLTTARSAGRAREVGVRKAIGASVRSLMKQFLLESYIYILISVVLAYIILAGLLPPFNYLASKQIPFSVLLSPVVIYSVLLITLVMGLLAGSYPSFYLAQYNPVEVLHGKLREQLRKYGIRNGLVVFQFFISSTLIVATLVVYAQLQYLQELNLGFNKKNIINLLHTRNLEDKGKQFKADLNAYEGIERASYCNRLPPNLEWKATFRPESSDKDYNLTVYEMDYDHLETMKFTMSKGRFFSPDNPTDTTALIINETAMKVFGWTDIEGKEMFSGYDSPNGRNRKVIGVIHDFNFRSAREPILPLAIIPGNEPNWEMAIRVKPGMTEPSLDYIRGLWKKYLPNVPFEAKLVEQNLADAYHAEQRTGLIFMAFTILAIVIAGLGLYGLASYMAEQRTKEIGIRKVLGGSITSITLLLNKNFLSLVILGNLLSYPFAAWYMNRWLDQFEYRISLSLTTFLITTLLTVLVAILSTSYRAIKAASASPVKSLSSE